MDAIEQKSEVPLEERTVGGRETHHPQGQTGTLRGEPSFVNQPDIGWRSTRNSADRAVPL